MRTFNQVWDLVRERERKLWYLDLILPRDAVEIIKSIYLFVREMNSLGIARFSIFFFLKNVKYCVDLAQWTLQVNPNNEHICLRRTNFILFCFRPDKSIYYVQSSICKWVAFDENGICWFVHSICFFSLSSRTKQYCHVINNNMLFCN